MRPFVPLFKNPHLQTICAHRWPRRLDVGRYPVESRLWRTEPDVEIRMETQRPEGQPRGEVVLVHGLEGSAEGRYMRGAAQALLEAGFTASRFQLRTCGGTERLCNTLYHAGLTGDLLAVLRQMHAEGRAPVHLVGFSLGGNVVLKLAGELGSEAAPLVASVCAICTPIDLAACTRRMAQRDNRLYEWRFLTAMRRRLRATGRYSPEDFEGIRSVYGIDDKITAPSFGFRGADHYYATQSSNQFLERIRVPTLLIQAKDDIFVPFEIFDHPAVRANPCIQLLATEYGGHVGFLARRRPHFWLDGAVVEWIAGGSCPTGS